MKIILALSMYSCKINKKVAFALFLKNVMVCARNDNRGFPSGSGGKEFACNAGDKGSIPGSGRAPGEGNGNLLHYSCLKNPMDRGAWQGTVHGVTKCLTQLSN